MKHPNWMLAGLLLALAGCSTAQTRGQASDEAEPPEDDIKNVKIIEDVTAFAPIVPIQVSGLGLVYGLQGTGGGGGLNNDWRQALEDQLHKQSVQNVKEMLDSPDVSMVFVTAQIRPGVHKGDAIDLEVTLPPNSKTTSLRGGQLLKCPLRNYETSRNLNHDAKSNVLLPGHILGEARGPLLVGFGEGDEDFRLRRGRIWEGGVSLIDVPLYLYLKDDEQSSRVANEIAQRINIAFPDDPAKQARVQQTKHYLMLDEVTTQLNGAFKSGGLHDETAKALNKGTIVIRVPFNYRLNPERYLLVTCKVPLRETPEIAGRYRQKLREMLLDPKDTVRAAIRLEALGKESLAALKKGLQSDNVLVRFASAEALTYLGSTVGIEELAKLAEQYDVLRGPCLTALASTDESMSRGKLNDLMASPNPQLRFGAFRALLSLDEQQPAIRGENMHGAFWLHKVAPNSPSMVHLSTSRRAEIVLFGDTPMLVPPFTIPAGNEFTLTAEVGDTRCTLGRFITNVNPPQIVHKQCSFDLEDVLRTVVKMGGEYPEAAELLRQVQRRHCLNCSVEVDQLPSAPDVKLLAAAGTAPEHYKDSPDLQQEVMVVQEQLGLTFAAPAATGNPGNRGHGGSQ